MNPQKRRIFYLLIVIAVAAFLYFFKSDKVENREIPAASTTELTKDYQSKNTEIVPSDDVTYLSSEKVVVSYVKNHGELPGYYISKSEARKNGWIPSKGNLCEVLHGRVIGGDYFGNFEKKLPYKKGRKYVEADLNYNCESRGADRLIFSNDHLIYVTYDHYKTFEKR